MKVCKTMSYLENTPFTPVSLDASTGKPLSSEALANRKRLILLWKIQNEKQAAMAQDLSNPENNTEEALTSEAFIELLRELCRWGMHSAKLPITKIEYLEALAGIKVTDTPPSNLN